MDVSSTMETFGLIDLQNKFHTLASLICILVFIRWKIVSHVGNYAISQLCHLKKKIVAEKI